MLLKFLLYGITECAVDFFLFREEDPLKAADLTVELVQERIPRKFGLKPEEIQVLSPMNRSLLGARNLNQVLQAALNPGDDGPEIQRFGWALREGKAISTRRDRYDGNGINKEGFHPFFTKAGELRDGLEFLTEKPKLRAPWESR